MTASDVPEAGLLAPRLAQVGTLRLYRKTRMRVGLIVANAFRRVALVQRRPVLSPQGPDSRSATVISPDGVSLVLFRSGRSRKRASCCVPRKQLGPATALPPAPGLGIVIAWAGNATGSKQHHALARALRGVRHQGILSWSKLPLLPCTADLIAMDEILLADRAYALIVACRSRIPWPPILRPST
jgi:hypothetical protein